MYSEFHLSSKWGTKQNTARIDLLEQDEKPRKRKPKPKKEAPNELEQARSTPEYKRDYAKVLELCKRPIVKKHVLIRYQYLAVMDAFLKSRGYRPSLTKKDFPPELR